MDNKLDMKSKDITGANIELIAQLFPSCITEQDGKKVIDFEKLKLEFDDSIADDTKEKYELTWPGKREAIIEAKTPTTKTLVPLKEKSVDFDNTKNVYIEGDNLEVLKVLQESYLNKIKCIYIDPPYNTGKDFIYKDNFKKDAEQELIDSGQIDELGNKFVQNTETNGRYHSDWLNMMYPRLKLARNLLKEDGVIFISIDDNEYDNLKKICDEIFGEKNFVFTLVRKNKTANNSSKDGTNSQHEYCLIYTKGQAYLYGDLKKMDNYKNPDNDPNGAWISGNPSANNDGRNNPNLFEIINPYTGKIDLPPRGRHWAFSETKLKEYVESGRIVFKKEHKENERGFIYKGYQKDLKSIFGSFDSIVTETAYLNQSATREQIELMGGAYFDYPKPVSFIEKIIKSSLVEKNEIVLDFFSGSATVAHAIFQFNTTFNLKSKFILVQIPEKINVSSNKSISKFCEENKLELIIPSIAQERIKRAAAKIKEETNADIDYGFRVFKLSDSTLNDNFYAPKDMKQGQVVLLENKFKDGVSQYDILTHIILDLGLTLDVNIKDLSNNNFIVEEDLLYVSLCDAFSDDIFDEIKDISPDKLVLSETSFSSDSDLTNVIEKLKNELPETTVSVI